MSHCYGTFELFPGVLTQGDCGSANPHDGHDFNPADKVCLGSPASFIEADCGRVGPHGEHPLSTVPSPLDPATKEF